MEVPGSDHEEEWSDQTEEDGCNDVCGQGADVVGKTCTAPAGRLIVQTRLATRAHTMPVPQNEASANEQYKMRQHNYTFADVMCCVSSAPSSPLNTSDSWKEHTVNAGVEIYEDENNDRDEQRHLDTVPESQPVPSLPPHDQFIIVNEENKTSDLSIADQPREIILMTSSPPVSVHHQSDNNIKYSVSQEENEKHSDGGTISSQLSMTASSRVEALTLILGHDLTQPPLTDATTQTSCAILLDSSAPEPVLPKNTALNSAQDQDSNHPSPGSEDLKCCISKKDDCQIRPPLQKIFLNSDQPRVQISQEVPSSAVRYKHVYSPNNVQSPIKLYNSGLHYRVGLSKLEKVEPLHAYLKKS